jgi:hypothetical protein
MPEVRPLAQRKTECDFFIVGDNQNGCPYESSSYSPESLWESQRR